MFLGLPQNQKLAGLRMSEMEWEVLGDIEIILEVCVESVQLNCANRCVQIPHVAQQVVSAERTPVLSRSIPEIEMLMSLWEELGVKAPLLKDWLDEGLKWAREYYFRMDFSKAYAISMCKSFLSDKIYID
jgi:hypothetical protein